MGLMVYGAMEWNGIINIKILSSPELLVEDVVHVD
jgi:hypothetical protein